MLHIIITLLFLPLFTSNLPTCETCFMSLEEILFEILKTWKKVYSCLVIFKISTSGFDYCYITHCFIHKADDIIFCILLQGKPSSCTPTISSGCSTSLRNPAWLLSSRLTASQTKSYPGETNKPGCLFFVLFCFVIRSQLYVCCYTHAVQSFCYHCLTSWQTAAAVEKKEKLWLTSLIIDVIGSFKTAVTTAWLFSLLRRFALTTKIPDTKGCHKCCIGEWPLPPNHHVFIYLPLHHFKLCQYMRSNSTLSTCFLFLCWMFLFLINWISLYILDI